MKSAATIPREGSPVKINPISASANDRPWTSSAKPGNVAHVPHPPFFSFDAPDALSRIGGEFTLVPERRNFRYGEGLWRKIELT